MPLYRRRKRDSRDLEPWQTAVKFPDSLGMSASQISRFFFPTAETEKRRIKIEVGSKMNIYIVLDASRSIGGVNFKEAQNVIINLIHKVLYVPCVHHPCHVSVRLWSRKS